MLYTYECREHGEMDLPVPLADWDKPQYCPECGQVMKKLIVPGHGVSLTDDNARWLASAVEVLQPEWEEPIKTRSEYKRYLKENDIMEKGGRMEIDGKWSMI